MAKEKNAPVGLFFRELFQLGIYKRSQGRVTRQVTFAALALIVLLAAWRLSVAAVNWRVAFGRQRRARAAVWLARGCWRWWAFGSRFGW